MQPPHQPVWGISLIYDREVHMKVEYWINDDGWKQVDHATYTEFPRTEGV